MKKLLALILAAALALSLMACGGGSGAGDGNTPSTGNGDATSTNTPSGGDNIPDETSEPTNDIEDATRYQLDDTVSTDLIELTVKKAS